MSTTIGWRNCVPHREHFLRFALHISIGVALLHAGYTVIGQIALWTSVIGLVGTTEILSFRAAFKRYDLWVNPPQPRKSNVPAVPMTAAVMQQELCPYCDGSGHFEFSSNLALRSTTEADDCCTVCAGTGHCDVATAVKFYKRFIVQNGALLRTALAHDPSLHAQPSPNQSSFTTTH